MIVAAHLGTSKIARRLIIWMITAGLTVTLLGTVIQLYVDYKNHLEQFEEDVESIRTGDLPALTESLWRFDDHIARIIVHGISERAFVGGAQVERQDAELIAAGRQPSGTAGRYILPLIYERNNEVTRVGELAIYADLGAIREAVISRSGYTLLSTALLLAVMAGFIYVAVERSIIRDLAVISAYMRTLTHDSIDAPLRLDRPAHRPDEISRLADAINRTRADLSSSHRMVRHTNRELEESEAKLKAILDNVPIMLNVKGLDGRYQFANPPHARFVGRLPEDMIGLTQEDIFPPERARQYAEDDRRVLETGETLIYETRAAVSASAGRFIQVIKFAVRDKDGANIGVGSAGLDITERKQAEQALADREAWLRGLFENAPVGIAITEPDGRYRSMNKTALEWIGRQPDDIVGKRPIELFGEELGAVPEADNRRIVSTGRPVSHEDVVTSPDGEKRVVNTTKAPMLSSEGDIMGICGFYVDVTEAKRTEAQLRQAQKMDAVGRFAGGVAHDFNNLLGAMLGFNEFLLEDLLPGTEQHGFAHRIDRAGRRAKELVSQILAFSRTSGIEKNAVSLATIADEAAVLLRGPLAASTRIVVEKPDAIDTADPTIVLANAGQISQVIVNLCMNANDAFEGGDGEIRIAIRPLKPRDAILNELRSGPSDSDENRVSVTDVRPGTYSVLAGVADPGRNYVRLSITDDGSGISRDVLEKMFDPFFTTKDARKGTGLGLSVVHGIVTAHEGAIRVLSTPGDGVRFDILLPRSIDMTQPEQQDEMSFGTSGHGLVLVVDDEPDSADMVAIGLERLGYEVAVCHNGGEALETFDEALDQWSAVITDQVTPDLRGMELIQRIKRRRPDIPCILFTGYSDSLTEEKALAAGADAYFTKPVSASTLANELAELLRASEDRHEGGE